MKISQFKQVYFKPVNYTLLRSAYFTIFTEISVKNGGQIGLANEEFKLL